MVSTLVASLDNAPAKPKKKASKFKQRQTKTRRGNNDKVEEEWKATVEETETKKDTAARPVSKFKQRQMQQTTL